jgi:aconitate hydratase
MGVLPLEFEPGQDASTIGLTGRETFEIDGISENLGPGKKLEVIAVGESGARKSFTVLTRIDTPNEADYYLHGGILQFVLRQLSAAQV